jgi:hydroxymethylbilane synthase
VRIVEISSAGDLITDVPLSMMEGTGFFTSSIERALAAGEVDVAVHSYKDLPVEAAEGLVVAAVPERAPVEDVLCTRGGVALRELPRGASVGTCSARRTAQVRAVRPDLDIRPLRGNVPTRVGRVTNGELDAIVLARAGLMRLGLEEHISEVFPTDAMLPAPAQGALAVQCRTEDIALRQLLAGLDHPPTRRAVQAERELLHATTRICSVPPRRGACFCREPATSWPSSTARPASSGRARKAFRRELPRASWPPAAPYASAPRPGTRDSPGCGAARGTALRL